jgi:2-oxoglutarate ferredoxin oxidoreductase subunit alpha
MVFAPSTVQEMADTVGKAFDLADEYRMPVMLLADGLIGQMMEPVSFADADSNLIDKPWATVGHGNNRGKNVVNSLCMDSDQLEQIIEDRWKRYDDLTEHHTEAESFMTEDAEILLVAYGSTARLVKTAVRAARAKGIKAGLLRPITLWPYPKKQLNQAAQNAKHIIVVEMSKGQMIDDVKLATECRYPTEFFGRTGGVVPSPADILAKIEERAGELNA